MGSPPIRHHLARHDGRRRGHHRTSAAAPVRHDGRHDDQPSAQSIKDPHTATHEHKRSHIIPAPSQGAANLASQSDAVGRIHFGRRRSSAAAGAARFRLKSRSNQSINQSNPQSATRAQLYAVCYNSYYAAAFGSDER